MKIDYNKILRNNMINVFKDVVKNIEKNGLQDGHHLYITFKTDNSNVYMPEWLIEKFPDHMTIAIQHEYSNFHVYNNDFKITLSFNNIRADLKIPFDSIISFADPYANFGLKLIHEEVEKKKEIKSSIKQPKIKSKHGNIIELTKFKKNKN